VVNLDLFHFDSAPLWRIVNEEASRNEAVRKVLVEEVPHIAHSLAVALNAHNTETRVNIFSLILSRRLMARISFTLGSRWNTMIFRGKIPLVAGVNAVSLFPED